MSTPMVTCKGLLLCRRRINLFRIVSRRRRRRRSLLRIVPVRGMIPNEMAPTRCRETTDLVNQPTRLTPLPRPPGEYHQPFLSFSPLLPPSPPDGPASPRGGRGRSPSSACPVGGLSEAMGSDCCHTGPAPPSLAASAPDHRPAPPSLTVPTASPEGQGHPSRAQEAPRSSLVPTFACLS